MYDSTRHSKLTVAESLHRPTTYFMPAPLLARPLCKPLQCNRKPPKNSKKSRHQWLTEHLMSFKASTTCSWERCRKPDLPLPCSISAAVEH